MPDRPTFVIVGANLAGGRAAEALRREGFDGRLVLIGAEPDPPYERPPLSKEYLRGEEQRDRLFIVEPNFYADNDIELRLGVRATSVDPKERTVRLDSGEDIGFDSLLIATGGRVRRLGVPGIDLEGVYYLRTVADSEAIAAQLQPGRRLVVIGAGFIGAEVAASAREKGLDVTVLEIAEVPLGRALGTEMGNIYADIHRDHGVDLRTGESVQRIEGSERAERVVASSGAIIDCDLVVVGVGIEPDTAVVEGSGIALDNGIVVDQYCQTSLPAIFAAGDVANFYSPVLDERIRVEHWANAQNQGAAAARNMLAYARRGRRLRQRRTSLRLEPYADVPWFWSDQYEVNMQYVGHASSWDQVVLRGSVADRSFSAFYLKDGRLRAAMCVNRHRDVRPSRELIRAGAPVDPLKLRDLDVELRSLVPQR